MSTRGSHERPAPALDPLDRELLNIAQRGLPLTPRPFRWLAERLGIDEGTVLARLRTLADRGILARVGSVVHSGRIGASTLVALDVPEERLDAVAERLGTLPEVNHNYARSGHPNLWLVLVAPSAGELAAAVARIAQLAETEVWELPMERIYHVDLGFAL